MVGFEFASDGSHAQVSARFDDDAPAFAAVYAVHIDSARHWDSIKFNLELVGASAPCDAGYCPFSFFTFEQVKDAPSRYLGTQWNSLLFVGFNNVGLPVIGLLAPMPAVAARWRQLDDSAQFITADAKNADDIERNRSAAWLKSQNEAKEEYSDAISACERHLPEALPESVTSYSIAASWFSALPNPPQANDFLCSC
jgi:hypothetical protein